MWQRTNVCRRDDEKTHFVRLVLEGLSEHFLCDSVIWMTHLLSPRLPESLSPKRRRCEGALDSVCVPMEGFPLKREKLTRDGPFRTFLHKT